MQADAVTSITLGPGTAQAESPRERPSLPPIIASLLRPGAYWHPAAAIELRETHISWVFLAGPFAYK